MSKNILLWMIIFLASCSGNVKKPEACAPFCEDGIWLVKDFVMLTTWCGFPRYASQVDSLLINGLYAWEVKGDTVMMTTVYGPPVKYGYHKSNDTLRLASAKDSVEFVIRRMPSDTVLLELLDIPHADLVLKRQK
jgi:hypothetical protein